MKLNPITAVLMASLVVGGTSFAGKGGVGGSSKAWFGVGATKSDQELQTAPDSATKPMTCTKCQSTTKLVKRDIAPKPGHGTKEVLVSVHECASCGSAMTRKLGTKEIELVHACLAKNESLDCCKTTRATGRGA